MAMTAAQVSESRDESRPRSIDFAGSVLVALTLTPVILALSEGSDWGWTSSGHARLPGGGQSSRASRSLPWRTVSPSRCSTWPLLRNRILGCVHRSPS
jgi:hypothetical protein